MDDKKIQHKIEQRLREALDPTELMVQDQSHLHKGHGATGGHFHAQITSPRFEGLSPLECQRLVYSALGDLMGAEIHAFSMKCKAS